MNRLLKDPAQILNQGICGFRQYLLSDPVRLSFVSQNLCRMLGVNQRELSGGKTDRYADYVHPADLPKYREFLQRARTGQQLEADYRLIRTDGTVLSVRDTLHLSRAQDGTMVADAVLSTHPLTGTDSLPCGFMRFTCEKQPRITSINQKMLEILHLPESREGEADYLDLYRENLFLMLPMEERRRFGRYLELVRTEGTPITGETTLLRCDGTKAHVFGWITRTEDALGQPLIQTVCMDVTQRYQVQKDRQMQRYLKALTDVYEKIFSYDRSSGTVKCIHDSRASRFSFIRDIPMQMEEATRRWISETVVEAEQKRVEHFFRICFGSPTPAPDSRPPRITYRAYSSSGDIYPYSGIVLSMDESVSLYCCRRMTGSGEVDALRSENDSLKENMQELIQRFTDGIAAFELKDGMVTPLYVTDNLCEFFGRTREEWMPMMKKATPIPEFVSASTVDYHQFELLLENGEAEFSYLDLQTGQSQKMKAICSHKSDIPGATRYVMLYQVKPEEETPAVSIRTFGYFDVFVGDTPIAFRNQKSKELLALLVDRQGGFITSEEAIAYLWEEEPVNPVTLARYRKVALRLKNILTEYGISDIVESVDGKRRLVPQKVRCDLYDYLSGQEQFSQLFKGSYLSNYSWAETTLAELTGDIIY